MKQLLILILIAVSFSANAQSRPDTARYETIIVYAQQQRHNITHADIKYILSKTANESIRTVLSGHIQTLRNNDVADNIIAIINTRDQADSLNDNERRLSYAR